MFHVCVFCVKPHTLSHHPFEKKVKFFFENFSKYFLKIFFKNCPMVAKWRFMTFGKKIFFWKFFYLISSLFFQMHKVRMCVVWHKIKIHATKCPYPRNVQIPFLWPKCLYYYHINRSKYTKIKRNTLYWKYIYFSSHFQSKNSGLEMTGNNFVIQS